MSRLWSLESHGRAELARWERVWATTGNVAAAWRCFRLARACGLEIPSSVLAEFDRIASGIEAEVENVRSSKGYDSIRGKQAGLKRETMARIVTRTTRGSSEPAADLIRWERDFKLAGAVAVLRHFEDVSEKEAVERVRQGASGLTHSLVLEGDRAKLVPDETAAVLADVVRKAVRRVRRLMPDADG